MKASTSDASDQRVSRLDLVNIPAELQHAILKYLPPSEIASFRLVSKHAAELGMHHIPLGINFSFRSHSIERLEKIVNHPVLSARLKQIRFYAVFVHQFSYDLDQSSVAEWKRHARGMMVSNSTLGTPHMSLPLQQAWWNQFGTRIVRIKKFWQPENLESIFLPAAMHQHSISADQAHLIQNAKETFERLGSCFSKLPMLEDFEINTDKSLECDQRVLYSFAKLASGSQNWIPLDKEPSIDAEMLLRLLHSLLEGQRKMSTSSRLESMIIPMPERVAQRLLDFSSHTQILQQIKTITFTTIGRRSIQDTMAMNGSCSPSCDPDELYSKEDFYERTWTAFPSILAHCVGLEVLNVDVCDWQSSTYAMDGIISMASHLRNTSLSQGLLVDLSIHRMYLSLEGLCEALQEYSTTLRSLTFESITMNSYPEYGGWIDVFYFIAEGLNLRDLLLKGQRLSQDDRDGQRQLNLDYMFPIESCGEDDFTFVSDGYTTARHLVQLLVCDSESHSSEAKAAFKMSSTYTLSDLADAYEDVYED